MSSNWIGALDGLAAGGVIDFDAPAYLLDKKPRYIGNPQLERLPLESDLLPADVKLKDIPQFDEFAKNDDLVNNPSWKKWMFGGLLVSGIAGAAVAVLTKGKNINFSETFAKIKNINFSKIGEKLKNINIPKADKVKNLFNSVKNKVKNFKFKK